MSEYNKDELEYAINKTGVHVDVEDVITVLRFLSGATHNQNDSVVIEGEEYNSDRVAMGGGVPGLAESNPTRRGVDLRDQAVAMATRDNETGATSSVKGTGSPREEEVAGKK